MPELNHREYYVARAETSRALAVKAADEGIARIHSEFADRYDLLAADNGAIDATSPSTGDRSA